MPSVNRNSKMQNEGYSLDFFTAKCGQEHISAEGAKERKTSMRLCDNSKGNQKLPYMEQH